MSHSSSPTLPTTAKVTFLQATQAPRPPSAPGSSDSLTLRSTNGSATIRLLPSTPLIPDDGGIGGPIQAVGDRSTPARQTAIVVPSMKYSSGGTTPMDTRSPTTSSDGPTPSPSQPPPGIIQPTALVQQPQAAHPQQQQQSQLTPDEGKCFRFFKTLTNLSEKRDPPAALMHALGTSTKQDLIPFLHNTLPAVRESLRKGVYVIEGIGTAEDYASEMAAAATSRSASNSPQTPQVGVSTTTSTIRSIPPKSTAHTQPNGGPVASSAHHTSHQLPLLQLSSPLVRKVSGPRQQVYTPYPPLSSTSATQQQPTSYINVAAAPSSYMVSASTPTASSPQLTYQPPSAKYRRVETPAGAPSTLDDSINGVINSCVAAATAGNSRNTSTPNLSLRTGTPEMQTTFVPVALSAPMSTSPARSSQPPQYSSASSSSTTLPAPIQQADLLLNPQALVERIVARMPEGVNEIDSEVLSVISNATEAMLRRLLSRLSAVTEHRLEPLRMNPLFKQVDDPRKQLHILEEAEKRAYEQQSSAEEIFRAGPAKGKLGRDKEATERAKQMQRADKEAALSREANAAAIAAIKNKRAGPASKAPTGPICSAGTGDNNPLLYEVGRDISLQSHKVKAKRVTMRDLQFVLRSDSSLPFRGKYLLYEWDNGEGGEHSSGHRTPGS